MFWKYAANSQENTHATVRFHQSCKTPLLKSHFGMDVLLYICCTFSEHLFLKTPVEGCFFCLCFSNCQEINYLENNHSYPPWRVYWLLYMDSNRQIAIHLLGSTGVEHFLKTLLHLWFYIREAATGGVL